jgi:hypothetical protein
MISRWRVSPSDSRLAISCRLAVSAHCMSSMNIASGCSGVAHAVNSLPNTRRSRFSDSVSESSGTGGCGPTISPSCGTRSTISLPLGPRACAPLPPLRDPQLAFREDVERQLAQRLGDREVRDVALVLLELARDQPAAPLARSCGPAREPATTCRCRRTPTPGPAPGFLDRRARLERLAQRRGLGVAAVQLLRIRNSSETSLAEREPRSRRARPRAQARSRSRRNPGALW